MLKKNKIEIPRTKNTSKDEISASLRQIPNRRSLKIPIRVIAYNQDWWIFDSTRIAEKRNDKNLKLRIKNRYRIEKTKEINQKRIEKSRRKGREFYTEKQPNLKDTLEPKLFFAEWFRYKYGERPIVFDTSSFSRSQDQIRIYMRKRGYYDAQVSARIDTLRNKKVNLIFTIIPNEPYIIDSVYRISTNSAVNYAYAQFEKSTNFIPLKNEFFDADLLNLHRTRAAKFLRDERIYAFTASHINFRADTNAQTKRVKIGVEFLDRPIKISSGKDSVAFVKHQFTAIRDVYFHIIDTTLFQGNFRSFSDSLGLSFQEAGFLRTFDTLYYNKIYFSKSEKKKRKIDPEIDSLNTLRIAVFLYNGELSINPDILELQNYLEHGNPYKEYYLERTYTRLMQLELFQTIKPVMEEIPGTNLLDVHYYLVPAKKQGFRFEPRATNSNGLLGVSASANYTNKNVFRGAEKLTFSIGGGFESQPPVFEETIDGMKKGGRTLNTFEIGPSLKLDLPGIFPFKVTKLSKRQRPRTSLSVAYNFQKREDFSRSSLQLNYSYQFYTGKRQVINIMAIIPPVIKFVSIDNLSPFFQNQLNNNDDLFLRNAYSDQFVWQDFKFGYEFNNKAERKGKTTIFYNAAFDNAGLLYYLSRKDTNEFGQRLVFGVPFSNFVRLDNELVLGRAISKTKSFHFRFLAGAGLPYLNSTTSLPYDYGFFAGGSNENRGWLARTLGPGSYQVYFDPNSTLTQIGDIRLGAFSEYRFSFSKRFKGAFFLDASNIWTINEDVNRPGSQFSKNFYKEIGFTGGFGLRADFEYFIFRFDLGVPLSNPALPEGARWIFQSRKSYYDKAEQVFGSDFKSKIPTNPFLFRPQIAIGYPF